MKICSEMSALEIVDRFINVTDLSHAFHIHMDGNQIKRVHKFT